MNDHHARLLFGTGAFFNFAAGLSFLLAGGPLSVLFGMPPPPNLVFSQIMGMAVVLFGAGYWMAAMRPQENRSVIMLGALGKVGVFAIATGHLLAGSMNAVFPAIAVIDLVYAILFWRYLAATR